MSDIDGEITEEKTASGGRYVYRAEGAEAEMTYSRASDALIIIDHTGVPDAFRGKGVGVALAVHAVDRAREEGHKILPLCPFMAAQFRRHPDWADVLSR